MGEGEEWVTETEFEPLVVSFTEEVLWKGLGCNLVLGKGWRE